MSGYRAANRTVYSVRYHLIWCPKYRRRVLAGRVEQRLKEILARVAGEFGLPCLWSPSWFVSTVGGAPLEVVRGDVENQTRLV